MKDALSRKEQPAMRLFSIGILFYILSFALKTPSRIIRYLIRPSIADTIRTNEYHPRRTTAVRELLYTIHSIPTAPPCCVAFLAHIVIRRTAMPSFFTSTSPKKSLKQPTAVFAGLDDPFNFPTSKMRYNSRSTSRTSSPDSAADSGYGSIDDDCPLSPKSQVSSRNRRRLQKDGKGHWRVQGYEYQSEDLDHRAERESILKHEGRRQADDKHEWKPDPKRTFTLICGDKSAKPKWYTSRVYGKALERKEKSEGVTDLERSMAPVIRRTCPSPSPSPSLSKGTRPPPGPRKKSTLLHPSPPPPSPSTTTTTTTTTETAIASSDPQRGRKPSTLLHPSPPPSTLDEPPAPERLRSPRNRSPTPLGIPITSDRQPAPTPLRICLRKPSVLHSCFSDSDSDSFSVSGDEDGEDADSLSSMGSAAGDEDGVVLARTAWVARAQRVRVPSPGLNRAGVVSCASAA